VRHCAIALLIAATVVAPWVAFNSTRFESSVLLTNNLGITLAGANCHAAYYDGRYIGYDTPKCWDAAHAEALAVSTDESVQSAFMKSMALDYVRANITRIPLVMTMREAWLVGIYRPSYVVFMSSLGGQPRWATWMQMLSFWILVVTALTLSFIKRGRPKRILDPLGAPVLLYILFTLALAAVFVGHWRYRSTLDIALILIIASRLSMGLREK
jgi:hypothetical protein